MYAKVDGGKNAVLTCSLRISDTDDGVVRFDIVRLPLSRVFIVTMYPMENMGNLKLGLFRATINTDYVHLAPADGLGGREFRINSKDVVACRAYDDLSADERENNSDEFLFRLTVLTDMELGKIKIYAFTKLREEESDQLEDVASEWCLKIRTLFDLEMLKEAEEPYILMPV
jgi:hypothetical protein